MGVVGEGGGEGYCGRAQRTREVWRGEERGGGNVWQVVGVGVGEVRWGCMEVRELRGGVSPGRRGQRRAPRRTRRKKVCPEHSGNFGSGARGRGETGESHLACDTHFT